ncbi:SPOC domain-like protein [Fomitiporia mediterranea MF3/22]|uniref:SPOC domain-like protein n=1 Tax=Fomitiporia mediterranea (strain MF3/22) TaxID=694068 RepID=UPI000440891C|nr:SPOC domain-like protein [Fomitiporia mediterranea MF3/22]EJD04469.1 SPOC domain-like protein [Fomitiporia mediterranea MF3/22]
MPAERAGYTVTMFCIDVSPSMGSLRSVEVSDSQDGTTRTVEMTNLAWAMQYVLLKIQEMIFHGRKTDQCGVILFGTEETNNVVNDSNGGYEHVTELIPIGQPNTGTLTKLQNLQPSTEIGDPIDAIIVAIETQDRYLAKKKSWTRKLVVLTDGENPIEVEDWDVTVKKINDLQIATTIIGVDFDDEEFGVKQEDKSPIKLENERFFHEFISSLHDDLGMIGTAAYALHECQRPEVKETKSALLGTTLRLGDVDTRPEEAIELPIKMSKCTAAVHPPTLKKFAKRVVSDTSDEAPATQSQSQSQSHHQSQAQSQNQAMDVNGEQKKDVYVQLNMQTEYLVNVKNEEGDDQDRKEDEKNKMQTDEVDEEEGVPEKVDKDQLIKGFKYGASYAPCPDGQFPRLSTRKGMDICGFFPDHLFRRELAMSEVQYVWADPSSSQTQLSLSSIVQAMLSRHVVAIARYVSRDDMDPKMGLLIPRQLEKVDCFLWLQMPFADDVRKYTFPSLENLVSKKGERITKHPFLPTEEQMESMEKFVDGMDLMHAGDKDETGERTPWFDPRLSYNPAVHRIKQALFHAAVVSDLRTNPLPPPHEEVIKYLEPPRRVLKRALPALEECKQAFKVRQVPKRVMRTRKDGHVRAGDDDDELLLLDQPNPRIKVEQTSPSSRIKKEDAAEDDDKKPVLQKKSPVGDADKMDVDVDEDKDKDDASESGSVTEPESDEEMEAGPSTTTLKSKSPHSPTQLPSPEATPSVSIGSGNDNGKDTDIINLDLGKEPGHLIGLAHPLSDFKKTLDSPPEEKTKMKPETEVIEELYEVLKEILSRPFARRRHGEVIMCLKEMRAVCLKKGHIDTWNSYLKDLKSSCLSPSKINNESFWRELCNVGTTLSLIGESEARTNGGWTSDVRDEEVDKEFDILA